MLFVLFVIIALVIVFLAARHQEIKNGRESYGIKDFLLEILNHTGDRRNLKR